MDTPKANAVKWCHDGGKKKGFIVVSLLRCDK